MASLISFAAAASSPQVGEGNAGEVCAAALDGRLAAAFPALRKLAIEPLALQEMAERHDAVDLAAALAGCGSLEALEVRRSRSAGECPPAPQEAGALLAQLVARLPRLKDLYVRAPDQAFFEVRSPP